MNRAYLVRHGGTRWTESKQHTSFTDLSLTPDGKKEVLLLAPELKKHTFTHVYTSPLLRAMETCEIAGYKYVAEQQSDLVEWNYGIYEGLTSDQIHQENPEWNVFTHGAPHGESIEQIEKRAHRVKLLILKGLQNGNVLVFSSGHFLRALASAWIQMPISLGAKLSLNPASLSILGWEHRTSVLELWNKTYHS